MMSTMTEILEAIATARPAPFDIDIRRLSPGQLRMLGLTDVAYMTASTLDGVAVAYTIRGADGIEVAAFEELDLALELLGRLDLVLVPVH
jgi:hypothetical protein